MLTQKIILDTISSKTNLSPEKIRQVIHELIEVIANEIAQQHDCRIHGFGTFKAILTKKRIGRNPFSGDPIKIPQKIRIRFIPGFQLRHGAHKATTILGLEEMAKLMVSELLLYNSSEIDEGIRNDDLEKRLARHLKDARENFISRIPKNIEADISIFENAWQRFIEKRSRALKAMQ